MVKLQPVPSHICDSSPLSVNPSIYWRLLEWANQMFKSGRYHFSTYNLCYWCFRHYTFQWSIVCPLWKFVVNFSCGLRAFSAIRYLYKINGCWTYQSILCHNIGLSHKSLLWVLWANPTSLRAYMYDRLRYTADCSNLVWLASREIMR